MQKATPCTTHFTVILIMAGLAAILILPAEHAQAQTPVTKIENASSDSVFVSFDDGAMLGLGEFNTGVIPASGAGTRMMWYPAKAALRTGYVDGTQWNDANIGEYSVAMGLNTTASGYASLAMGRNTTASGSNSTALGRGNTASGTRSTALGAANTASGFISTAMGLATTAATSKSLSIGEYNSANTSDDGTLFVVGNGSSSSRSDALVLNQDAGLVVKGEYNTGVIPASGAGTRMMWHPAKAAFRTGYVDGTQWDDANIGNYSVAMGQNATASGSYSTAMGGGTTASGFVSTAMGSNTTASGDRSTALGDNTIAAQEASLSVGEYNSANSSADGTLFVVGNGLSGTRTDALVVDDTGNLTIGGTLTESSDRRLKNDITPLEDGVLGKLSTIEPSSFEFKNQQTHPGGPQIGIIAQEVQKQFPELVSEASNGYLSVSYSKFTAVLLKGLQEQQTEIQTLKNENNNIKKRLAKLEQQNSRAAGLPWQTTMLLFSLLLAGGMAWKIAENNDF